MKDSLLVLYTGGTFGMQASEEGLVTGGKLAERLALKLELKTLPAFDLVTLPHLIDSSNVQPSQWTSLANTLIEHYADYRGFVVIHGTDTLAYTASMLSFLLQGLNKTVVITGAQMPLEQDGSDAANNFSHALRVAEKPYNEVVVVFDNTVLRGNRCSKVSATAMHAFDTPAVAAMSYPETNSPPLLNAPLFIAPNFTNNAVGIIHIHPGISAEAIAALSRPYKAIIFRSFGLGNLPVARKDIRQSLQSLAQEGVIMVNSSQCYQPAVSMGHYAEASVGSEVRFLNAKDMTLEAAFTKLHFLLATTDTLATLQQRFEQNLVGELSN